MVTTGAAGGRSAASEAALAGGLTIDQLASSMPVASGLYEPSPTHYRGVESITVRYRTDPEQLRTLVPDLLHIVEPATVSVVVLRIPNSTLGRYLEVQLQTLVHWQGTIRNYNLFMYVTEAAPIALGRELLGAPKKGADVELRREAEAWVGTLDRPRGVRLLTAAMAPQEEIEPGSLNTTTGFGLMVYRVQGPEGGVEVPTYLVETPVTATIHEQWAGPGAVAIHLVSDLDPLYRLPVLGLERAVYTRLDLSHTRGRVVTEWDR